MWCVEWLDGTALSLSFHSTARQTMDALAALKRDGATRIRVTDDSGAVTSERLVAALAAKESEPAEPVQGAR